MQLTFLKKLIASQLVNLFTSSYPTQISLLPPDEEKHYKAFECSKVVLYWGFQTFSVMYLCRRFGGSCRLNLQVKFLTLLSIEPPQSNAIGLCSLLSPSPLFKVLATISASSSTFFLHFLLCVPLLHSPWRFQVKACFCMAEESSLSFCEPLPYPQFNLLCYWVLSHKPPHFFVRNNIWQKDLKAFS